MGMARSAGKYSTEIITAIILKLGKLDYVDFYSLIHFIDYELEMAMKEHGYRVPVEPIDLIYCFAGCHSSFAKRFADIAKAKNVDLFKLIVEVSKIDRKAPSVELIEKVADTL